MNNILLPKCLVKRGSAESLFCSLCYWFWLHKREDEQRWSIEEESSMWLIVGPVLRDLVVLIPSPPSDLSTHLRLILAESILSRKLLPVLLSPIFRRCSKVISVVFIWSKMPRIKGRKSKYVP